MMRIPKNPNVATPGSPASTSGVTLPPINSTQSQAANPAAPNPPSSAPTVFPKIPSASAPVPPTGPGGGRKINIIPSAPQQSVSPAPPAGPAPEQRGGRTIIITTAHLRAARMQALARQNEEALKSEQKAATVTRQPSIQGKEIKHSERAVMESGFATPFAAALVEKTKEVHCSIALRAGQAPNIDAPIEISPKPMAVKTKTSSDEQGLPVVAGWIPIDQATFGRSGSKDVPSNFGGITPEEDGSKNGFHLQTSLRSILADAKVGKYDVVKENNFLVFTSKLPDKTNYTDYDKSHGKGLVDKNQISFRINLEEAMKPAIISLEKAKELRPEVDRDPGSMLAKLGITEAKLIEYDKQAFSIDYKLPGKEDFNPLLVAAQNGKPITGDADKLWVAPSIDIVRRCKKMANVKYNAGDPSQLQELIQNYIVLKSIYSMKKLTKADVASEYEAISKYANTAGIITPFELLSNKIINDEFIKSMPYAAFLLQHGPETNNPGPPSDLDGKIFHVHDGQTYLTESEDELVGFVLNEDIQYLENKFVMVHPGWKMQEWSPVIEKQIKLGQDDLMNSETIKNYIAYKKTSDPNFPDAIEQCKSYLESKVEGNLKYQRRGSIIPDPQVKVSQQYREKDSKKVNEIVSYIEKKDNLEVDPPVNNEDQTHRFKP